MPYEDVKGVKEVRVPEKRPNQIKIQLIVVQAKNDSSQLQEEKVGAKRAYDHYQFEKSFYWSGSPLISSTQLHNMA